MPGSPSAGVGRGRRLLESRLASRIQHIRAHIELGRANTPVLRRNRSLGDFELQGELRVPPTISEQVIAEELMQEMEEKLADVKQEQVQEQKRLCEQLEAANREKREMQEKLNAAFCAQASLEQELSKWTGKLVDLCKTTDAKLSIRKADTDSNMMRDVGACEALPEKANDLRKREEDLRKREEDLQKSQERAEFEEAKLQEVKRALENSSAEIQAEREMRANERREREQEKAAMKEKFEKELCCVTAEGHAAAKRASELESRLHECSTGLIKLKDQLDQEKEKKDAEIHKHLNEVVLLKLKLSKALEQVQLRDKESVAKDRYIAELQRAQRMVCMEQTKVLEYSSEDTATMAASNLLKVAAAALDREAVALNELRECRKQLRYFIESQPAGSADVSQRSQGSPQSNDVCVCDSAQAIMPLSISDGALSDLVAGGAVVRPELFHELPNSPGGNPDANHKKGAPSDSVDKGKSSQEVKNLARTLQSLGVTEHDLINLLQMNQSPTEGTASCSSASTPSPVHEEPDTPPTILKQGESATGLRGCASTDDLVHMSAGESASSSPLFAASPSGIVERRARQAQRGKLGTTSPQLSLYNDPQEDVFWRRGRRPRQEQGDRHSESLREATREDGDFAPDRIESTKNWIKHSKSSPALVELGDWKPSALHRINTARSRLLAEERDCTDTGQVKQSKLLVDMRCKVALLTEQLHMVQERRNAKRSKGGAARCDSTSTSDDDMSPEPHPTRTGNRRRKDSIKNPDAEAGKLKAEVEFLTQQVKFVLNEKATYEVANTQAATEMKKLRDSLKRNKALLASRPPAHPPPPTPSKPHPAQCKA